MVSDDDDDTAIRWLPYFEVLRSQQVMIFDWDGQAKW